MMRVIYVTTNVLGDSGANAAELFPKIASVGGAVDYVGVADFPEKKKFFLRKDFSDYIVLRKSRNSIFKNMRAAIRIARVSKKKNIDIIHVFYRQENALLCVFLRIALMFTWAKAVLLIDHRSVNLARGWRGFLKKMHNLWMQCFVHHMAGNPWAVETNHWFTWKPKHIIDLGYDTLPVGEATPPKAGSPVNIWFIGSLRPKNRKSEFLIQVFEEILKKAGSNDVRIHVAGPAQKGQVEALMLNPLVIYYGELPRAQLYELLRGNPGVGIAFMNQEFHDYAPSLKFVEYAAMRYHIVASNTIGLRTQTKRLGLKGVVFVEEVASVWADRLLEVARNQRDLPPTWDDMERWSYKSIFERQVVPIYEKIKRA